MSGNGSVWAICQPGVQAVEHAPAPLAITNWYVHGRARARMLSCQQNAKGGPRLCWADVLMRKTLAQVWDNALQVNMCAHTHAPPTHTPFMSCARTFAIFERPHVHIVGVSICNCSQRKFVAICFVLDGQSSWRQQEMFTCSLAFVEVI